MGGPALLAFAADAGAFAALSSKDVGVAGVGVAPPQVRLRFAGEQGVVGVVGAGLPKQAWQRVCRQRAEGVQLLAD
jgi:hypothetical protein